MNNFEQYLIDVLLEARGDQYFKGVNAKSALNLFRTAKEDSKTKDAAFKSFHTKLTAHPYDHNLGLGKPIHELPRSITKRVRDVPFASVPSHHDTIKRAANKLRAARKKKQTKEADLERGWEGTNE